MDLAKQFATDPKKEQEGVWLSVGEDASLLIARKGNKRYNEKMRRVNDERAVQRRVALDTLSEDEGAEIMAEILAETVLLGWKGIEDEGVEVPYSVAAAKERLIKYKDFRKLVEELADETALFRDVARKDKTKNLKKS